MTTEKFHKDRDRSCIDDNLRLLGRTGCDIGQCPCSFKLNQGMRRAEEFHESANDTSLNDLLDRWVALFGEQFSKLGRRLDLCIDLVREHPVYHLREFGSELCRKTSLVKFDIVELKAFCKLNYCRVTVETTIHEPLG